MGRAPYNGTPELPLPKIDKPYFSLIWGGGVGSHDCTENIEFMNLLSGDCCLQVFTVAA